MSGFGSFLKVIREDKDLSITEVANLSRVSRPYLSQIESNEREPSLKTLHKLSVGLDLPLAHLIERAGYSLDIGRQEDKDTMLIHHFLRKIETKLEVYSEQIEELEKKKHELYRKQNGLLNDLNEKSKKTGGKINNE